MKLLTTIFTILTASTPSALSTPAPPAGQASCTITPNPATRQAHYELVVPVQASESGCKAFTDHAPPEIMSNRVTCVALSEHSIKLDFEAAYDVETLHVIVRTLGVAFPAVFD